MRLKFHNIPFPALKRLPYTKEFFYGMKFYPLTQTTFMINFLEAIGAIKNKTKEFKIAPAIIMMILMLLFLGTTVYILIASLNY
jgi:hypothetical protein